MQITNTPNNQNFTARYLLKGDAKTYEQLYQKVLPLFHQVNPNKNVQALSADLFFRDFLSGAVDKCAKETPYSKQWLLQNAENHGIKINLNDRNDIFVFTDGDIAEIGSYLGRKPSFLKKISTFFKLSEYKDYLSLPKHLSSLSLLNDHFTKLEREFYNFAMQDCKKVNSIQELMYELTKR